SPYSNIRHWYPRTFWGVPIEGESGSLWGVLLIDSQSESLPDEEETNRDFGNLAHAFKALLKKV
ncbi:MAG TPA: GAF domain-containing protein, partial [Chthoniobacterales bacterium]|nr:GAF domain-containing protein [Chthoniobacterales bacterium]